MGKQPLVFEAAIGIALRIAVLPATSTHLGTMKPADEHQGKNAFKGFAWIRANPLTSCRLCRGASRCLSKLTSTQGRFPDGSIRSCRCRQMSLISGSTLCVCILTEHSFDVSSFHPYQPADSRRSLQLCRSIFHHPPTLNQLPGQW